MGCCFSRKFNDSEPEAPTGNHQGRQDIALKSLSERLAKLYDGEIPQRSSEAPRLSDIAALELRLEELQKPLGTFDEDDDESNQRCSQEIIDQLQIRLRNLGSGSTPEPCDLRTMEVLPKEKAMKKKLSEQKHIEDLHTRLNRLKQPLGANMPLK